MRNKMNMTRFPKTFFAALAVCAACLLDAEVKMPSVFSDNMLVQRGKPAKFWGTAEPGAEVAIEFAGQKKSAKAGEDGRWKITLSPLKASSDPREFKVYENGAPALSIKNVVVGELWILGGQSNMQWTLEKTDDAHVAVPRANYPNLRYFRMNQGAISKTPLGDFSPNAHWEETAPENAGSQSAVGFYFGEKLLKDLGVPVGLVQTAMGGTLMAGWTPEEYISRVPYQKKYYEKYLKDSEAYVKSGGYKKKLETYKKNLAEYEAECKKAKEEGKPKPPVNWGKLSKPLEFTPYSNNMLPVQHWNAKAAPLAGLAARGVVWYQGEQESGYASGNPAAVAEFGAMYENMVAAWREKWGDEKLWFLCVQLPSYGGGKLWAELRAQQLVSAEKLKHSKIANSIDLGAEKDVHPRDKTLVGERLAKIAERVVYNKKSVAAFAPKFVSAEFSDGGALVKFESFGKKLAGKGEPRGFELRIGGKWVGAKPEIRRGAVFVASPDGKSVPEGVRYLWKPWARPDAWLYSTADLPAFPFEFEK